MPETVRTTASRGLRLRNSPHDGETMSVLPQHTALEVLDSETWLRVRTAEGRIGFVLSEYIEPHSPTASEDQIDVEVVQYESRHGAMVSGNAIRIDKSFEPALEEIENIANENNLKLYITSSLRRPRQALVNTVVEPAKFSNHHVGHAIDMNVIMDGTWFNSAKLAQFDSLPARVQSFLREVHENVLHPLRWGGRFNSPDPVHIDDSLNINNETEFKRKFFALWGPEFTGSST